MKTTRMMCRLALGALLVVGCDRSDNTPKSPAPAPPSPDVTPKADSGMSEGGGGGAGATAGQSGAGGSTPSTPAAAAPTTRPTADASASLAADLKAAEQTKQAQDLLDQAMAAMKDKRFDEARASLDKVESMGGDLPKTIREQATTMRKSVDNLETAPAGNAPSPPPPPAPDEVNK